MAYLSNLRFLTVLLLPCAAALVPPAERRALVEFFDATGGQHWGNATGWLSGDPCEDRWFGIFCNAARSHVVEVFPNPRESGNSLQGTLPASFWTDLPELGTSMCPILRGLARMARCNLLEPEPGLEYPYASPGRSSHTYASQSTPLISSCAEHIYLSNDRPPGWSNLTVSTMYTKECRALGRGPNLGSSAPSGPIARTNNNVPLHRARCLRRSGGYSSSSVCICRTPAN
jgi:hypothetical protein